MQYLWLRRGSKPGCVLLLLLLMIGCEDGSRWTESADVMSHVPVTIAGSVGDGPIVNADIVVRDARGRVVITGQSDDQANYFVEVPPGTRFPLHVEASGGLDLVSGEPADFTMQAILLDVADSYVNISPMTTLVSLGAACRPGGVNAKNLDFMWGSMLTTHSMGFDRTLLDDPMRGAITAANAPAVVYANEGLGEAIRRTHAALQTTSSAADMGTIVQRLACDLATGRIDGSGRAHADPRTAATFVASTAGIQLEMMSHRLMVNGQDAMVALNQSLATILPDVTGLRVQDVPVTQAFIDQAHFTLAVLQSIRSHEVLERYVTLLETSTPGNVTSELQSIWNSADQVRLAAMPEGVALSDGGEIDALLTAIRNSGGGELPIVALGADREVVPAGDSVLLSWYSEGAARCHGSGADGWNGRLDSAGTMTTRAIETTTTFTLSCSNANGTTSRSVTVVVEDGDPQQDPAPVPPEEPPPADPVEPSVSLSASPSVVSYEGQATLTWSSEGVTACTASGGWSGSRPTSGTTTVGPLTSDTTFTLSCDGEGGSATATASVSVTQPVPPPAVSLSASPSSVSYNGESTLTWSSEGATDCAASGGWSGSRPTSGSTKVGPLTSDTTFTLTCSGAGGSTVATTSVSVSQPVQPSVSLSASPSAVSYNGEATLTWSSEGVTECTASGGWSGSRPTSGSTKVGPLTSDTTFTLSCSGAGGSTVAMTSVSVRAAVLSWEPPTTKVDGSPLTNLAGYRIHYGTGSRAYSSTITISDPETTSFQLALPAGTYYFAMTAFDSEGEESTFSNEVSKVVH